MGGVWWTGMVMPRRASLFRRSGRARWPLSVKEKRGNLQTVEAAGELEGALDWLIARIDHTVHIEEESEVRFHVENLAVAALLLGGKATFHLMG